jgi:hypothetical protein
MFTATARDRTWSPCLSVGAKSTLPATFAVTKNTISSGVQDKSTRDGNASHEQERAQRQKLDPAPRNRERTDQRKLAETPCTPPNPVWASVGLTPPRPHGIQEPRLKPAKG